jgi:hypothetical protein
MQRVQKAHRRGVEPEADQRGVKAKLERCGHLRIPQQRRHRADRRFALTRGRACRQGPQAAASPWNVLAEDYWDLYTLLLR